MILIDYDDNLQVVEYFKKLEGDVQNLRKFFKGKLFTE